MEMPNQPVFTKKIDDDGRMYYTGYANKISNCVVSYDDKNMIFSGNPKINLRSGSSKFGDELFIELLCDGSVQFAPKNSWYDSIEIYFPSGFGIDFLKKFIEFVDR